MANEYRLIQGDALTTLGALPALSVHCCITSPPFYGLRDYGTGRWEGGDVGCDHKKWRARPDHSGSLLSRGPGRQDAANAYGASFGQVCGKCGARRIDEQLGLEPTPDAYVARLVEVFREVRRVLHPSGTLWCNLGDSYNTRAPGPGVVNFHDGPRTAACASAYRPGFVRLKGLADKQLLGMPWRIAFALQADGWILRSDIIWSKPNPMPESVRDRPVKSHEHLFLLSKQPRYYYDSYAIRESSTPGSVVRHGGPAELPRRHARLEGQAGVGCHRGKGLTINGGGATGHNRRSVWTITPRPFKGAHFATFPPALVEPCILAGTSERGACPRCGAPWRRLVERGAEPTAPYLSAERENRPNYQNGRSGFARPPGIHGYSVECRTIAWRSSCTCPGPPDPIPCTVLDPFAGACSAGVAALRRDRHFIGIDLSSRYLEMGRKRLARVVGPLFAPPVESGQAQPNLF